MKKDEYYPEGERLKERVTKRYHRLVKDDWIFLGRRLKYRAPPK